MLAVGVADPTQVLGTAPLPLQPAGVSFTDPIFGTTLTRVSDTSEHGGFESQIYSQLQAFSSDNEHLLLAGSNGYVVRRVDDLSLVTGLDTSEWNAPRWHPAQSHVLVHFDSNADSTVRVQFTDVNTLITQTVFSFPNQYERVRGNQSFDELSNDGRWLGGMLARNDGANVIFSLDLENLTVGAELPLPDLYSGSCAPDPVWGELEPDWVGVSPLGNYVVVQWVRDGVTRCSGMESFDIRQGQFVGRVTDHHHHGDLGLGSNGVTEIFMTSALSSPEDNNFPALVVHELPGTETASPPMFLRTVDWGVAEHFSLQGPHGVGLISAGRLGGVNDSPFENELYLQYTDGSVLRLVHHRSSECGYWVQPRGSVSRDGRYVVFSSDWGEETGVGSCGGQNALGAGDPYIIDLMAGSPPLTVTSFLPTATGFTAGFNKEFDASVLNLYDMQSAGLGPADVVLEGATTGEVPGSLVVDSSSRRITFVKTGGPLTADTYTATLRSATDGFKDALGNLLDGDGNSIAADNMTQTFTITAPAANAISVSLPDFVRGPGQEINLPAHTNSGIPVTISEGMGVRAVELRISYDPTLLEITSASVAAGMPPAASVVMNNTTSGLAVLTFFSENPLTAGSNTFVELQAGVPATNASEIYRRQHVLDVHSVTITDRFDNALPAIGDDAVHSASYFGDVSGSGRINASDASQVARVAASLDRAFGQFPWTDPMIIGDVSGNGLINASDASKVAQYALQLPVAEIPLIPGGILIAATIGAGPWLAPPSSHAAVASSSILVHRSSDRTATAAPAEKQRIAQALSYSAVDFSRAKFHALGDDDEALLLALEEAVDALLFQWSVQWQT